MPSNRHEIDEEELVRPPELLRRGLSLASLAEMYVVEAGWCAVITCDGQPTEILEAGSYPLFRFGLAREVVATAVSRRRHTLRVETVRHFTIGEPYRAEINLDLAVDYRSCAPRRLALEISRPVETLFDRVLAGAGTAVKDARYPEIEAQAPEVARATLAELDAMELPDALGLEVLEVRVTAIGAPDMAEWHRIMLAEHVPELAKDVARGILDVEKIMLSKGLDPSPVRQELNAYFERLLRQWTDHPSLPSGPLAGRRLWRAGSEHASQSG